MNSRLLDLKIENLLDDHENIVAELESMIRTRANNCRHELHRVWDDGWFVICTKCGVSSTQNVFGAPEDIGYEDMLELRRKLTGPINLHGDYDL